MAENLYSPGQKSLSKQGRENWDRIFGGKDEKNAAGNWRDREPRPRNS